MDPAPKDPPGIFGAGSATERKTCVERAEMVSRSGSVKPGRREDATTPAAPRTIPGDWEPDPGRKFRGLCKIFLEISAKRCLGPGIPKFLAFSATPSKPVDQVWPTGWPEAENLGQ